MFGGGLPVLYRTETARQKDWATVPTILVDGYKNDLDRYHYSWVAGIREELRDKERHGHS